MEEYICSNCEEYYESVPEDAVCYVCGCDSVVNTDWYFTGLGDMD